ncbi:hypothetical protein [Oribacterium sinus]|uniref:Uncharacterized protein n=1 Tax=Oribacterium sinus TaxID=237576 RepID=A0A930DPU4_9FIRM|nr:hypothetical protein [Oribacterium sinus]MBF1273354.1 hypothetical protein [Oribacterium sinus]
MYLFFEYSLLALGLFFFGLIGFWKGIENTKKIRGLFYESRSPKESFLLRYFGRIFTWIFLGGFAGYTFFFMALRFHLRNHEAVLQASNPISSNFAFTGKMLGELGNALARGSTAGSMISLSLFFFMLALTFCSSGRFFAWMSRLRLQENCGRS